MSAESSSIIGMDISASPCTSTQCPETTPSPSCMKMLYSKIISSYQRSERMPSTVTPENIHQSPFVKPKVLFNPFNRNLRERLENPIFSPDVFSTAMSPSQDSEEFKWTIDDLSKINPAQIEEEFHFEEQVDEKTESEMQKTIEKYFTKTHMIPSPWDCKLPTSWSSFREIFKKEKQFGLNELINKNEAQSSPQSFSLSRLDLVSNTSSQNASTQTTLSLPPDLPENINSALKPYFTDNSFDDINLSMNSLRRKLFFQNDDEPLSPVRLCNVKELSPSISLSCYPSTPVIELRTDGSPLEIFSPLDVSPICRTDKKLTCNNSSAMQIDSSVLDIVNPQDNVQVDQSRQRFAECYRVVESPKLVGVIRRNRKRRRPFSQDMNMSISYSSFAAKRHSTESTKIGSTDTISQNFAESQDTGYGSETTNTEKYYRSDGNIKLVSFDLWKNSNKENVIIASTPTKGGENSK